MEKQLEVDNRNYLNNEHLDGSNNNVKKETHTRYALITAIFIIAICFMGIAGFYYGKKSNEDQIKNLKQQIVLQQSDKMIPSKREQTPTEQQKNSDNIFLVLPKELQVKDKTVDVVPTNGFFVVNSILSNTKKFIVYSEINDCIGLENDPNYRTSNQCDWKYRIYVKNLITSDKYKLYGYPEDKLSLIDMIIPKVHAGGCPLVYLPIGWSKNDEKIVLQSVNPTSCGAGGGTTKYQYASINSNGGPIEGISNGQTKFYDNFSKAIFVGGSEKSPQVCGPINQRNNGKLVFLNIETGNSIKTIEESNTDYSLGEISSNQTQLEYFTKLVTENDGCAEIDYSSQGEKKLIKLP